MLRDRGFHSPHFFSPSKVMKHFLSLQSLCQSHFKAFGSTILFLPVFILLFACLVSTLLEELLHTLFSSLGWSWRTSERPRKGQICSIRSHLLETGLYPIIKAWIWPNSWISFLEQECRGFPLNLEANLPGKQSCVRNNIPSMILWLVLKIM